jgi:hypothetical protein
VDAGLLKHADGAVVGTGGFIDTADQRLGVQHVLPIVTPEELARVSSATSPMDSPAAARLAQASRSTTSH